MAVETRDIGPSGQFFTGGAGGSGAFRMGYDAGSMAAYSRPSSSGGGDGGGGGETESIVAYQTSAFSNKYRYTMTTTGSTGERGGRLTDVDVMRSARDGANAETTAERDDDDDVNNDTPSPPLRQNGGREPREDKPTDSNFSADVAPAQRGGREDDDKDVGGEPIADRRGPEMAYFRRDRPEVNTSESDDDRIEVSERNGDPPSRRERLSPPGSNSGRHNLPERQSLPQVQRVEADENYYAARRRFASSVRSMDDEASNESGRMDGYPPPVSIPAQVGDAAVDRMLEKVDLKSRSTANLDPMFDLSFEANTLASMLQRYASSNGDGYPHTNGFKPQVSRGYGALVLAPAQSRTSSMSSSSCTSLVPFSASSLMNFGSEVTSSSAKQPTQQYSCHICGYAGNGCLFQVHHILALNLLLKMNKF